MQDEIQRKLQGGLDSNNMWVLGVILVIIGSLGNNLGNNLVSLDHNKKQKEKIDETSLHGNQSKSKKSLLEGSNDENDAELGEKNTSTLSPRRGYVGVATDQVVLTTDKQHTTDDEEVTKGDSSLLDMHGDEKGWLAVLRKRFSLRQIGVTLFIVGNLATFASFGFAAQSLLASLESIQFVSNVFFVRYVHKEIVTWRMIIATTSIVAGNTLVVLFSDHASFLLTSSDLIHLYATNVAYWGYLTFAMCLWAITHFIYSRYYHARIVDGRLLWKHGFVEPFTFAVSSAIIGTQAVLQSKCMSMLIQVSARGTINEFERPHIWWILVTWLLLVTYWVKRIDTGLALFPPLFIIPVMQVFFVFFAIVCGGIYFGEFMTFGPPQFAGVIIGVLMILGGVYGLAPTDVHITAKGTIDARGEEKDVAMGGEGKDKDKALDQDNSPARSTAFSLDMGLDNHNHNHNNNHNATDGGDIPFQVNPLNVSSPQSDISRRPRRVTMTN